jgi:hypothetical protein
MAGIELELSVVDKGSAEINAVARRAMSAFDQVRAHALSAGTAITGIFRGAISHVTSFVSHLFSIRGMLLMLAGGGGIMLLSRAFQALGEMSEPLAQRFSAIKDAISGFIGRVVEYIGRNPTLLRALDGMAYWISDMAARLPNMEVTIQKIITYVVDFVQKELPKIWDRLKEFWAWVKEAYETAKGIVQGLKSWLGGGTTPNNQPANGPGEGLPNEMDLKSYVPSQPTVGTGMGVTNIYFNGEQSRSDIVSVVNEANRQAFRDDSIYFVPGRD